MERLKQVIKSPLTIAITLFTTFFLLACLFGVDPSFSFWSSFERGEGGFQILHFLLFFVLLSVLMREKKDWHLVLYFALVGGLLMFFYGVFAGIGKPGFIGPQFKDPGFRFQGSIGNPAYVAAYTIFMMFYALYLFFDRHKNKLLGIETLVLGGFFGVFFATFFLAATRGAFLGLIGAVVAGLIYFAYHNKKWRNWLLPTSLLIVALVVTSVYFKNTPFIKSLPGSRIFDISFTTKTFRDRALIWRMALDGFKARPILGWGPENFINVFDQHYNTAMFEPSAGFGAWFDRAHSVFLDYLTETGILGLLSYLSIFGIIFLEIFSAHKTSGSQPQNNTPTIVGAIMFAMPVAYLIQGIVLFDVFTIYLPLFLYLGLVNHRYILKTS